MDKDPNDQVTIAMATQPCRVDSYVDTVYQLLPQCDRFCICFNGFDELPTNLPKSSKIITILANGKNGNPPDLGCNNKMYWLGKFSGYYATVDDDISYPNNYIQHLKQKINKYDKRAICSLHGHIYESNSGVIKFKNRKIYGFIKQVDHDVICNRLGMGVAMCVPSQIGISADIFLSRSKNFGDDEITAIWAQENNIPLIRVSNDNIKLIENTKHSRIDGLCVNKNSLIERQHYLESYTNWKLILPNTIFNCYDGTIGKRLLDIEEQRHLTKQDRYIITGQLNSITTDQIDSLTFYRWLKRNGILAKYIIQEKHTAYNKSDLNMLAVKTNCITTTELLDVCYDDLVKCRAFIQENAALNTNIAQWLKKLNNCDYIFLQHGEFKNHWLPVYENILNRFNYINVSSINEQNFILTHISNKFFKHRTVNPFLIGGLPRRSLFKPMHNNNKIKILFMPTWRKTFLLSPRKIINSKYFNSIKQFINTFINYAYELNAEIFFSPHHATINQFRHIFKQLSQITICNSMDVHQYVQDCDICITDFSSISTDFSYQNKPVIFWQLDYPGIDLNQEDQLKVKSGYIETNKNTYFTCNYLDVITYLQHICKSNLTNISHKLYPDTCKKLFNVLNKQCNHDFKTKT